LKKLAGVWSWFGRRFASNDALAAQIAATHGITQRSRAKAENAKDKGKREIKDKNKRGR